MTDKNKTGWSLSLINIDDILIWDYIDILNLRSDLLLSGLLFLLGVHWLLDHFLCLLFGFSLGLLLLLFLDGGLVLLAAFTADGAKVGILTEVDDLVDLFLDLLLLLARWSLVGILLSLLGLLV